MIKITAVAKHYERRAQIIHALLPTTIDVQAHQFAAVIGPSGSGKSTLLTIVGGMLTPTSGKVYLDGDSLYDLNVKQRSRIRNEKVGFVFQNFNLVPWLSAIENVQLPLTLYGTDRKNQRTRVMELLERFGLADRSDHRPAELSAGQQQRVALARTLIMNPSIILADEPTGNLDPQSRDRVIKTFSDLRDEGRAVLLVTHDTAVSAAADRVFHIDDGTLSERTTSNAGQAA